MSKRQKVDGKHFLLRVPAFVLNAWKDGKSEDLGRLEIKTDAQGNPKLSVNINYGEQGPQWQQGAAPLPSQGIVNLRSGGHRMAIFQSEKGETKYVGRVKQVADCRMHSDDPNYNNLLKARVSKAMIKTSVTEKIMRVDRRNRNTTFSSTQYKTKFSLLVAPVLALNEKDAIEHVRKWIKGAVGAIDFVSIKRQVPEGAKQRKRGKSSRESAYPGVPSSTVHNIIITLVDVDKHNMIRNQLSPQHNTQFGNGAPGVALASADWVAKYPDTKRVIASVSVVASPSAINIVPVKQKGVVKEKRMRLDRPQLDELILNLFRVKDNYTMAELWEHTNQPKEYLKEVLGELCDKDAKKHIYFLKAEYKS